MRTSHPITPLLATWIPALTLFATALGAPTPSAAAETDSGSSPRNRASFQVDATREIANDWATARLSVIAEGKEPAAVAATVNEAMSKALARAKRTKQVEVRSGAYVTQPVYDDGRVVRWRARQELRVESGDVDRLAKLIGQLQSDAVLLSGIDFSVRRETRKGLEDELIAEALAAFRDRAGKIAKGMGSKEWSLIEVSVGHSGAAPRHVMMEQHDSMMLSRAKTSAPSFDAGTSELSVHVSGVVELE